MMGVGGSDEELSDSDSHANQSTELQSEITAPSQPESDTTMEVGLTPTSESLDRDLFTPSSGAPVSSTSVYRELPMLDDGTWNTLILPDMVASQPDRIWPPQIQYTLLLPIRSRNMGGRSRHPMFLLCDGGAYRLLLGLCLRESRGYGG